MRAEDPRPWQRGKDVADVAEDTQPLPVELSICLFLAFVVQTAKNDLNRDFLFQYRFTIIFRKKDPSAESEVLVI